MLMEWVEWKEVQNLCVCYYWLLVMTSLSDSPKWSSSLGIHTCNRIILGMVRVTNSIWQSDCTSLSRLDYKRLQSSALGTLLLIHSFTFFRPHMPEKVVMSSWMETSKNQKTEDPCQVTMWMSLKVNSLACQFFRDWSLSQKFDFNLMRPWERGTQLSCSWIPNPQTGWK